MNAANGTTESLDLDRFSLRRFVEAMRQADELDIREEPVDLVDVAAILQNNPKAVWFKNAGGQELIGNVVGSRSRLAMAFGVPPGEVALEVKRRLSNKPQLVELRRDEAPVQQVVQMPDEADLLDFPVHLQHGMDGAPYISATIDYTADPATGRRNCGMRRLMMRGPLEAGVDLIAPSDLRVMYMAASARGERVPVAYVIGCHPIDMVSATMKVPTDELELLSSLRAAPLPVVKCVTNDLMVPADAEIVIEGYFHEAGYVEKEGPYGEYLGYYGGVKTNPVFHVTAITRRQDALFQTATISGNRMDLTDTSNLEALRMEMAVWSALEGVARQPVAVYAPVAAGGSMSMRFSIKPTYPGESRSALYAVLGAVGVKNVFVVNDDIDIFDDNQMEWAFGTRFQADRDLVIATGVRLSPLDPSLHGARTGAKAGYDLTWPMEHADRWELRTPSAPTYEGKSFPSIRAALQDGPKRFEELIAAVGSRDGREIVRELHGFRGQGLERDERGRYFLKT
ncbi:UbiD family decarboxylase [Rhodobacter sp. NTK016B]|uniref:UbiD family decarboxylase n=1 Tax=Rhodobacter sp. NTK016B TaxID=2759676 RepID=UPI001A8DD95D|nr:UbiD family decarboxylase [Rhodobacter sp. NTK016B]MBN8293289.1 UbiD family decarboxylase [Rhodobacter sp. NTK016B]